MKMEPEVSLETAIILYRQFYNIYVGVKNVSIHHQCLDYPEIIVDLSVGKKLLARTFI